MADLGRRGMFYLAAAVSDFFLPEDKTVRLFLPSVFSYLACCGPVLTLWARVGRTQDPKWSRNTLTGDGSSSESVTAFGARMESRRVHSQLQGELDAFSPFSPLLYLFIRISNSLNVDQTVLTPGQLETDPALLIPKSRAALSRYGHQLVIGNDLHRRKYQVVFVERAEAGTKGSGDTRLGGAITPPVSELNGTSTGPGPGLGNGEGEGGEEYKETWLRLDELEKGTTEPREGEVEIEELIIRQLVERHQRWIDGGHR